MTHELNTAVATITNRFIQLSDAPMLDQLIDNAEGRTFVELPDEGLNDNMTNKL